MATVATRAGRLATLKAAGLHDRLRPIEATWLSIGPELALRIVVGNGLADEKRQRVIFVAIARLESEEDVVLVAVTISAGVEHFARRCALGREDPQNGAKLAIFRAVVEYGLARRTRLPLLHQPDVRLPRSVARLARDPHFRPGRLIGFSGDIEILHEVRRVAVHTRDVPDLPEIVVGAVGNRRDFLPIEPALRFDVPEDRQHVDAAVGQLRQIPLKASRAERVVHLELFRRTPAVGDRDQVPAIAPLHGV